MEHIDFKEGTYFGNRTNDFKRFIGNLLKKAKLKSDMHEFLTTDSAFEIFDKAFTCKMVNPEYNYDAYEQIGDGVLKHFFPTYFRKRFNLTKTEDVKVIARLVINYGSKGSFSSIADKLQFWDYITALNDTRYRKKKPLLEDAFEAFFGAIECIFDSSQKHVGISYVISYSILQTIFDDIDISVEYNSLYDAKTRLKELCDFKPDLGTIHYSDEKEGEFVTVKCYVSLSGKKTMIGDGKASLKADAQQNAAKMSLKTLESKGIRKPTPKFYKDLQNRLLNKELKIDYTEECNRMLNTVTEPRKRTKHEPTYSCVKLAEYCSVRNFEACKLYLENESIDATVSDSEGMSCLDLLFFGGTDLNIYSIFKKLIKKKCVQMKKEIYENYFIKYLDNPDFEKKKKKLKLV